MTSVYGTIIALAVDLSSVEAGVFIRLKRVPVMALEALIFFTVALLAPVDAIIAGDALALPMVEVPVFLEACAASVNTFLFIASVSAFLYLEADGEMITQISSSVRVFTVWEGRL